MLKRVPPDYDPDTVCLTFDVEWAPDAVIADLLQILDERGLRGTFFVTHGGVSVPGHERGLHPNFRKNGDIYRSIPAAAELSDVAFYEAVIASAMTFAPEAKGIRTHSLFFDTSLLGVYRRLGLQYDSTLRLELAPNLQPHWKQNDILEIPTYYADYFDMDARATGWDAARLNLDAPGLKVFDFHPVLIFINAPDVKTYDAVRPFYTDVERLRDSRYKGKGTRTLFIDLLDEIARRKPTIATMEEINGLWQSSSPSW